jgi:ubiquinone/menaquinone biosynthesis C-methylase UbiE
MLVKSKKSHGKSWDYYWDYVAQTRLGRYITNIERDFILRCLSALREKPELILDAGAGSGRHVPLLSSFASWVIATEIESKLIQRISRVAPNVLPLLVSAASESFPVADRSVDCVICLEVPYIAEQNWFFAECKRVLKPRAL